MLMPRATILRVALNVPVTPGTREMGSSVKVSDSLHTLRITGLYVFILVMDDVLYLIDIDECERDTHNCNVNASCADTEGSFMCACNQGYMGDGVNCAGRYGCVSATMA